MRLKGRHSGRALILVWLRMVRVLRDISSDWMKNEEGTRRCEQKAPPAVDVRTWSSATDSGQRRGRASRRRRDAAGWASAARRSARASTLTPTRLRPRRRSPRRRRPSCPRRAAGWTARSRASRWPTAPARAAPRGTPAWAASRWRPPRAPPGTAPRPRAPWHAPSAPCLYE